MSNKNLNNEIKKPAFFKPNFTDILFRITLLGVNLLFLCKYASRQNYFPTDLCLLVYTIFFISFLYIDIFEFKLLNYFNLKKIYKIGCFLIIIILFIIIYNTDGNSINVDRWSAMDVGIKALFNGEYPYTATDHLNGRTSNFPGLLIIGMPFYLLGNVAYLQVFAFLLLSYTIYNYLEIRKATRFIFLLLLSPAYWWEIFSMSDLLSNVILVFCFILFTNKYLENDIYKKPIIIGIISSFLVLTRGIMSIPLVLYLFKDFFKTNLKNKILFVVSFIVTFILLLFLVLANCPSLKVLKFYNPLILQTSTLPAYINVLALSIPFYFSFLIRKFEIDFFKFSITLMFLPILFAFVSTLSKYNFNETIYNSRFDLSYLTIVFPFLIIYIVDNKDNKLIYK